MNFCVIVKLRIHLVISVEEACPAGLHHSGFSCRNHAAKTSGISKKPLVGDFRKRTLSLIISVANVLACEIFSDVFLIGSICAVGCPNLSISSVL